MDETNLRVRNRGRMMIFEARKVIDKTGQEVILRNAEKRDAQDLIHYLKMTTAETPYLIREPDEVTLSVEYEEAFIQNMVESERGAHVDCNRGWKACWKLFPHEYWFF